MQLTIVTINYNGSERTIELLKSLKGQTNKNFRIIVVDNASEEDDFNKLNLTIGTMVNTTIPMVIRNGDNLGFSGGNNVGIKMAMENSSDWVLLLNNDTWVETGFISDLRAVLSLKEGLIGLPIDEGDKIVYAGFIQWLRHTFRHYDRQPGLKNRQSYIIGGALAISRNAFNKIGGLDEKYFLYFEDADYTVKARKNNIPVEILDKPIIHHAPSSTTKKLGVPLLLRYHYRNALYFNRKNGPWDIKILVWFWSFWIMKKQLLKIMFMYKQEESYAILNGVIDFYKNKYGKL